MISRHKILEKRTGAPLSLCIVLLATGFPAARTLGSFKLLEANWADAALQKDTCGLLAGFNAERQDADYSPILVRNAIQMVPGVFGSIESFSFALGGSRGRVTVSESLNFDVINENANRGQLKGLDQMRLRDMTLMEFYTRVAGGWDPLYFAREFYLFSGRLPRWFQQGNFQDRQPLNCLKELSCPGCSRKQGKQVSITSARFQVTTRGSIQALRYETNPTILLVTKGETLVQLVSPKDVGGLKPYERDHPLYRRSSLAFETVAKKLGYVEVLVRAGDALIFDAYTAHQTHSINDTIYFSYSIRR